MGLFQAGKGLLSGLLAAAQTRLELFSVELREDLVKLVEVFIVACACVILASISVILLTITVVVAVSDDIGTMLWALGIFSLIYGVVAFLCYRYVRRTVEEGVRMFQTTIEELKKDQEWLNREE